MAKSNPDVIRISEQCSNKENGQTELSEDLLTESFLAPSFAVSMTSFTMWVLDQESDYSLKIQAELCICGFFLWRKGLNFLFLFSLPL